MRGGLRERQRLQDEVGSSFIATIEHPNVSPMLRAVTRPRVATPPVTPTPFISVDPVVARIVQQTEAAAQRKMPILIRGETGTGKEQLARHAHAASGRSGSFVAVNCAALPESLIEAELFGYGEGAFTGARKGGSSGLVKEADGGTLFLDEIGDMPVTLQAVLLRFLDDWTVRPVGGAKRQVDVLLISATNADLSEFDRQRPFSLGFVVSPQYARGHSAAARRAIGFSGDRETPFGDDRCPTNS